MAHTIRVYSRFTFDYPYPVIISVNGPIPGMEYPMITFQDPRPEEDGTYSEGTKHGLIGVVIHEVGHYFGLSDSHMKKIEEEIRQIKQKEKN